MGRWRWGWRSWLGSSQGSKHQLSGSTLRARPSHPSVPSTWLLPAWQVCGLTGLFHHGILGKSFPALDLELLMLMVGLKVT